MILYSIWPYFIITALLLAFVATPLFKAADTPPSITHEKIRVFSLDGLRGFLALGVFFHHAAMFRRCLEEGVWDFPPSRFYIATGQSGVALFFMITGYLFWGRLIKEHGKPGWIKLYTGRFFRIMPLYFVLVAAMLVIVFAHTGMRLNVSHFELVKQLAHWLVPGLKSDINGYPLSPLATGMTWTLKYEGCFYLSLLVISFAARFPESHLPFSACGLLVLLMYVGYRNSLPHMAGGFHAATLFLCGMTVASLEKKNLSQRLPDWVSSCLVILLVAVLLSAFDSLNAALPYMLLAVVFYLIIGGSTLFGLLKLKASRRLGDISYGIYLLQGVAVTLVFWPDAVKTYALASPLHYWGLIALSAMLLIVLATITHVWVERPGIKLGKNVVERLESFSSRHLTNKFKRKLA